MYPKIKMVSVVGTGGQHANRLGAEPRAGKFIADIFINGSGTGGILAGKGFFDPFPPVLILPENRDQSVWFGKKHLYADPTPPLFNMEWTVTSTIALYNTKRHKPGELKTIKDLLNPKRRGKMVVFDPMSRGQLGTWKGIYYNKSLGPEFIQRLFREMDVTVGRDIRLMIDWIAKGSYELYIGARNAEVQTAKKQRLPVDVYRAPKTEGHLSGGEGSTSR